jgi:hypothetical protein
MEKEYLERIISLQKEQLDKYHEYVLCSLNNGVQSRPLQNIQSNQHHNGCTPLFDFIDQNLNGLENERALRYLEASDNNGYGLIGLVECILCPDKFNLNFSILNNSSFVKYKQNDNSFITENIQDFSQKVCLRIHEHCKPFVSLANEIDEHNIETEKNEDEIVLDTLCEKNMQRVKNFNHFKFSDMQVRLIKKVFSGIKAK